MTRAPAILVLVLSFIAHAVGQEPDSDKDGLTDFHEVHKYFTDPQKRDSDNDQIDDGDWHERREFTYSIRSVVKVMRPCNTAVIQDDYQDGRVLSETKEYVELEVIHYPLNTNAEAIGGSQTWRQKADGYSEYVKPGVTTNWDDGMRADLIAALQNDGIKLDEMTDKEIVVTVSQWLLARGQYKYRFGTYFIHFPKGEAAIFPGLEDAFRRETGNTDLPFPQHLQCEVFGKGMFYNKSYGTCTSTATYLTTGLRAVGIPTRMVLAIPVVDGSDPDQITMIENHLSNHHVRKTLLEDLPRSGFAAHTFNEVLVDGRWVRLNYRTLGQNIYGSGAMGMLTHVHTFNDLSDADLTETWGVRYGHGTRDATFQHSNPYRTTEISDRFGMHCKLPNPPAIEIKTARITKLYWFFSSDRPAWISEESVRKTEDGHLLMHVDIPFSDLKKIYPKLPVEFTLTCEGKPSIRALAERGYWNEECYLRIPAEELKKMEIEIPYELVSSSTDNEFRWEIGEPVHVIRPK